MHECQLLLHCIVNNISATKKNYVLSFANEAKRVKKCCELCDKYSNNYLFVVYFMLMAKKCHQKKKQPYRNKVNCIL